MKRILIAGQIHGRLTIISDEPSVKGVAWVHCRCICGTEIRTRSICIRKGLTTSCGCLLQEHLERGLRFKHGGTGTVEYALWKGMLARCSNPNVKSFKDYGERNITVCEEWRTDFAQFLKDMGKRPTPEHTLERKNNELGYSALNCVWLPRCQQANNTRQNNRITWNGETHTLADWCRIHDKPYNRTAARLRLGWSFQDALHLDIAPGQKRKRVLI